MSSRAISVQAGREYVEWSTTMRAGVDVFRGRKEMLAGSRSIVEIGARGADATVIEVRGDDRCLVSIRYYGDGAELTVLDVIELAADGRLLRSDVYEVDDLDAARSMLGA